MGVVLVQMERSFRSANRGRRGGRHLRPQLGVSLIEATIAAALLLIIAAGVLPLFAQSLANNIAGADSSAASNGARSQTEQLFQLPFNSVQLTLVAGNELVLEEYYSLAEKKWKLGAEPSGGADPALWTRTATIRQYSVNALDDELVDPAEAHLGQVHLKEIEVAVLGTRTAGPLGPSRRVTVRTLKSQ